LGRDELTTSQNRHAAMTDLAGRYVGAQQADVPLQSIQWKGHQRSSSSTGKDSRRREPRGGTGERLALVGRDRHLCCSYWTEGSREDRAYGSTRVPCLPHDLGPLSCPLLGSCLQSADGNGPARVDAISRRPQTLHAARQSCRSSASSLPRRRRPKNARGNLLSVHACSADMPTLHVARAPGRRELFALF